MNKNNKSEKATNEDKINLVTHIILFILINFRHKHDDGKHIQIFTTNTQRRRIKMVFSDLINDYLF